MLLCLRSYPTCITVNGEGDWGNGIGEENIHWGIRRRYENHILHTCRGENGNDDNVQDDKDTKNTTIPMIEHA